MKRVLNVLLVTALVAPLLVLTGCCEKSSDCYDKTSGNYSK